jgi:hypothetical protein
MAPTPANGLPFKVFYSYSHKDEKLRTRLATSLKTLEREGLIENWCDRQIGAGTEWARQIHERLESSDIILLLISFDFVASSYCYDLEMKRALVRHAEGKTRVVPIMLRPTYYQNLPFSKLQFLPEDGKPVTKWKIRDDALVQIVQGIRRIVEELLKRPSLPIEPILTSEPALAAQPSSAFLPNTHVLLETGPVPVDSEFYEPRDADRAASQDLKSRYTTIIVKGYRQSGKSSLLTRLHFEALDAGQQSCYLSFRDIDESSLKHCDTLFPELAWMIADDLGTGTNPDNLWSDRRGPVQNLTRFLHDAVLDPSKSDVLLLFDDVDFLFERSECRDELFAMIRSWHNHRVRDRKGSWKKLRLVIAHATDPALWISNLDQSPFNVGHKVSLDDFDQAQVADLNLKHGRPLKSEEEIRRLIRLVGGHPYLVRLSLYTLVTRPCTIEELETTASGPSGPFLSHLNWYSSRIAGNSKLRTALRQIVKQGKCRDDQHFQKLLAAGLIRGASRDQVAMRCQLYHDYFKERL